MGWREHTDNFERYDSVDGASLAKVHATPVIPLVGSGHRVDEQMSGMVVRVEVSSPLQRGRRYGGTGVELVCSVGRMERGTREGMAVNSLEYKLEHSSNLININKNVDSIHQAASKHTHTLPC